MRCPFCGADETKVIDSRLANEGDSVRRRRKCLSCSERFTTFETAELALPRLVKQDGSREPFNEEKMRAGMMRALEKRPVSAERIEDAMAHIKRQLAAMDAREVASRQIGELVMRELKMLDHVAYIRFASVYLSFEDIKSFEELICRLEAEPTPEMQARQVPLIDDETPR